MTLRKELLPTANQEKPRIYLQRVNHLYHQIQKNPITATDYLGE